MTKQEYIDYFTRMQDENEKSMLGGMAWDGIVWRIHDAVDVDKVFTNNELADMFPKLLGHITEN